MTYIGKLGKFLLHFDRNTGEITGLGFVDKLWTMRERRSSKKRRGGDRRLARSWFRGDGVHVVHIPVAERLADQKHFGSA